MRVKSRASLRLIPVAGLAFFSPDPSDLAGKKLPVAPPLHIEREELQPLFQTVDPDGSPQTAARGFIKRLHDDVLHDLRSNFKAK